MKSLEQIRNEFQASQRRSFERRLVKNERRHIWRWVAVAILVLVIAALAALLILTPSP